VPERYDERVLYQLVAEVVLVVHFGFLLFVVLGGLLVLWRPRFAWIHVPAFLWGAIVSLMGWICPLTPLENHFRLLAGASGYAGTFVEQYIAPIVYPGGLTREFQLVAGVSLPLWNLAIYGLALWLWKRRRARLPEGGD
jgi:hypothetical protein